MIDAAKRAELIARAASLTAQIEDLRSLIAVVLDPIMTELHCMSTEDMQNLWQQLPAGWQREHVSVRLLVRREAEARIARGRP